MQSRACSEFAFVSEACGFAEAEAKGLGCDLAFRPGAVEPPKDTWMHLPKG